MPIGSRQRVRRRDVAIQEMRTALRSGHGDSRPGDPSPHGALTKRIADARERMQLPDEALAWHRLVLRDFPKNGRSASPPLARLGDEGDPRTTGP